MTLLKELALLSEEVESSDLVKAAKPHLNKISSMLFGQKCGPVVDEKRSKEAKFFGVANARSKIMDAKGRGIKLTFDNSTDSGEFEINSLTPLKIVRDGELDKKIKALYKRHKVHSKKKTNYLDVDGDMVLREIHIGVSPNEHAVKLVRDAMKLIRGEKVEDEPEEVKESLILYEALPFLSTLIAMNLRKDECFVVKAYISKDKSLELDDAGGGPKVYAQGSLKDCQNWILKNPRFISTIVGTDRRMKSHKVPRSYGIGT